jgi:hypothetical protein
MFETGRTALELNPTKILAGVVVATILLFAAVYGWFWYGWVGLIAALWVLGLIRDAKRTKLIKEFACDTGLTFIGNSLPGYFPMRHTSSCQAHSIKRVLVGNGVLLFDCRIGSGKGSRGRTVVAGRGKPSAFGWTRFGPDFETEQAGEWALVYGSRRLLELEEIGALVSEFSHHVS